MARYQQKVTLSFDPYIFSYTNLIRIFFVQPFGTAHQEMKLTVENHIALKPQRMKDFFVLILDVVAGKLNEDIDDDVSQRAMSVRPHQLQDRTANTDQQRKSASRGAYYQGFGDIHHLLAMYNSEAA
jgi:hypothetical protein